MKQTSIKLILVAALMLMCGTSDIFAEENNSAEKTDSILPSPEFSPEFPGGNDALRIYFTKNLRYPWRAANRQIEGRVICQFTVDTVGRILNIKVVKSVNKHLDKEAVRVIESMPLWKPAFHQGKKVYAKYTIPIGFFMNYD